jgi:hypothetical protein
MPQLQFIMQQLPKWRQERLPPPRVNQSQVGLPLGELSLSQFELTVANYSTTKSA